MPLFGQKRKKIRGPCGPRDVTDKEVRGFLYHGEAGSTNARVAESAAGHAGRDLRRWLRGKAGKLGLLFQ